MLDAPTLVSAAVAQTSLSDFGGDSYREGLDRLVEALGREDRLTALGEEILGGRLRMLLANRLRIEDVYRHHPEIEDQEVQGPLFIIGLPRTGTSALSQLLALDPQIRSLRTWESADPVPPPERASQHTDPRIAQTEAGLDAMDQAFPRMRSLHLQTATGPVECQDLLGMEFRTTHFDGMAHVPSYTAWAMDCDMVPAYRYHRRTLRLLQWHCPPNLWHLKTPVHMLSLDALATVYPDARFLWTHRAPSAVLASVCSLIAYTRSWVSDRDDALELGAQQLALWVEAVRRAVDFRARRRDAGFADVSFGPLNADPVATVRRAYGALGLSLSEEGAARMAAWAAENPPGAQGTHQYTLADFGLRAEEVDAAFSFYTDRFAAQLAAGGTGPG